MQQRQQRPTMIFSACAPSDAPWLEQWEAHLHPLEQAGTLSIWSSRHLQPGTDRVTLLHDHLDQANFIVLLLSADFFTDDECFALMEHALARHQQGTVRLLPLLLRPVAFHETPLAPFTTLPSNGRPVTLWENPEAAFDDCVRSLRRILGRPVTTALVSQQQRVSVQEQNRVRMLRRLRRSYSDLISQSLQGAAWLELGMADKPDAVQNATNLLLRISNRAEELLPVSTSITWAYDEAEHELLILGEPGAGKSTLLLDLAQQLVMRAEQDETHPLPVILPLSSWAIKRPLLQIWIAEQLVEIYDVPRKLSAQWVQEEQILPLLDGLDEMEETARSVCIAAINIYHRDHLAPLVVCSRTTEYKASAERQRLALQEAVVVQPLTREDVDAYLERAGQPLTALRSALKRNAALHDLATIPLMLNILILTYQGKSVRDLSDRESLLQKLVWDDYVRRMVERKGNGKRYPLSQTTRWLGSLADLMKRQSRTIFFIEQLQPDWLSGKRMLRTYNWLGVYLPNMLIGMLLGLAITTFLLGSLAPAISIVSILLGGFLGALWSGRDVSLDFVGSESETRSLPWVRILRRLGTGILIGFIIAVVFFWQNLFPHSKTILFPQYWWASFALSFGLSFGLWNVLIQHLLEVRTTADHSQQTTRRQRLVHIVKCPGIGHGLLVGLFFALISGAVFSLVYGLVYGLIIGTVVGVFLGVIYSLIWGMIGGLVVGLILGLVLGLNSGFLGILLMGKGIMVQPVDRLVWSWGSLRRKLFAQRHRSLTIAIGLTVVLSWVLFSWLVFLLFSLPNFDLINTLGTGLILGLLIGFSFWLLLGLLQGVSNETVADRHRIVPNQGIHHSALNGFVFGLICAVVVGLIKLPYDWLSNTLMGAPSAGLPVAGLFAGLVTCLLNGGLTCLRHYILRFLLWRSRLFPWKMPQFLDDATVRFLLRRVGGGYSFTHRLLLDHFSDMETR